MYNKSSRPVKRNEVRELGVFLEGKTFKISYSVDSLKEILNSNVFSKIQIPVYMHNSTLFGEGKKGLTTVGYIISYNDTEETMKLSIFNKFISKIDAIEDAIVFPRVSAVYDKTKERTKDEVFENIKIIGFDIASESFYNN